MTSRLDSVAVLTDPDYLVPPMTATGPDGGIAWLRANVARFADGAAHRRRRDLAVKELVGLDILGLRADARATAATIAAEAGGGLDVMARIARTVPVAVLAQALGAAEAVAVADEVAVIAARYQSDVTDPVADDAVATVVGAFGGVANEATAARIGLLVQACDATAALIGNALVALSKGADAASVVVDTARQDPPVLATRRLSPATGEVLRVDLTGGPTHGPPLAFGAGAHACPGHRHAVAMAEGVLEALRGLEIAQGPVEYEPSANLRIPARLEVRS